MKPLGQNQRFALQSLLDRQGWTPGCGWVWGTYSETIRLLDSLVRRGLAARDTPPRRVHALPPSYKITEAGKQEVLAGSAYYRLKYGAKP